MRRYSSKRFAAYRRKVVRRTSRRSLKGIEYLKSLRLKVKGAGGGLRTRPRVDQNNIRFMKIARRLGFGRCNAVFDPGVCGSNPVAKRLGWLPSELL